MEIVKTLCVMGLFNQETNQKFFELSAALEEKGFEPDRLEPHLTFGIYAGVPQDALLQWIEEVSGEQKKIPVNFNHIGFFGDTNVCFAAPCVDKALLDFHEKLHVKFDDDCYDKGCFYSLKSGSWVPHATLAIAEPEVRNQVISVILDSFKPFTGTITQLKITEVYPMQDIKVFDLHE